MIPVVGGIDKRTTHHVVHVGGFDVESSFDGIVDGRA